MVSYTALWPWLWRIGFDQLFNGCAPILCVFGWCVILPLCLLIPSRSLSYVNQNFAEALCSLFPWHWPASGCRPATCSRFMMPISAWWWTPESDCVRCSFPATTLNMYDFGQLILIPCHSAILHCTFCYYWKMFDLVLRDERNTHILGL